MKITIAKIVATVFLGAAGSSCLAQDDLSKSGVGYKTVEAALSALKASPNVRISTTKPDGWVIVEEPAKDAQWSFVPASHYAHPSVVKRILKQDGVGVHIEMTALCENSKPNCDKLIEEFKQLNDRIREDVQRRLRSRAK